MILFTKEWSDFDFLKIELLLPEIIYYKQDHSWDAFEYTSKIELNTYIKHVVESGIFYSVSFRLLGFGINYYRQTSF
jgi:hypothetical protein